jgi:hypothetical protein
MKTIASIKDLVPDEKNANRGTQRGRALLESSLRQYGVGRPILADKNGRIIAGDVPGVMFRPKAQLVMSIRMPHDAGAKMLAARERTGKSLSDCGEALVRWFAPTIKHWPILPGKDRRIRLRRPRRK